MNTTPAIEQSLLRESLVLVHRGMRGAYIGAFVVSTLLTAVLWQDLPRLPLLVWYGYMLGATAARAWLGRREQRHLHNTEAPVDLRLLYTTVTIAGLGWGAMALFLPLLEQTTSRALLAVAAAGVTAASGPVYAFFLPAARIFYGVTLVPLIAGYLVAGSRVDQVLGLMIMCYLGVMLRNAGTLNAAFRETLRLRFENADIVDRLRRAQQESEALNADLHQRIARHQSIESDLIKARDEAETAARAKAEFLANMSHEIRTPMNGVLGMAELLQGTGLSNRQQHLADTILRSGRSLLNIINDILDFSKIEAGKLALQSVPFDLRQFIEELGEMFAESAHRAGLELACDMPADIHSVYRGDPDRLRQVLTNLLSNALKFTARGEVVLRVGVEAATDEQVTLRFAVTDSGIGIAPEHQERIFDSFTQADGSTTRQFGGTGLGLAICRQLVELMGGRIGLDSEPGRGSTFWFSVPMAKAPLGSVPVGRIDPAALGGMRVLVVAAADTAREVLLAQLGAWDLDLATATAGADGLLQLARAAQRGRPFSAVVFARELPDMPASLFTQRARNEAGNPELRLVMLTTVANLEATGELLAVGVSAYVTRPVRQRDLYAALLPRAQAVLAATARSGGNRSYQARVLLVEDNVVNQELARSQLEALGCTVRLVSNGQEAVDAVTEAPLDALREPYDLVLMDCQMPVMDGYAATEALRAWEHRQGVTRMPIVALTANALEGDRERCLARGMDDYLAKPFSRDQLEQVLGRWLPQAIATTAPRVAPAAPNLPPTSGVLDEKILARVSALQREGAPDLLGRLIELFLDSVPRLMREVEEGSEAGDAALVRRAAHTLKSSSANLGATGLAAQCAEIEAFARAGDIAACTARIDILAYELDNVAAALKALRPELAATPSRKEQQACRS